MLTCGGSFTALLGCGKKLYSVYELATKIVAYRASPSCPLALGTLRDYLCTYRAPRAPVTAAVVVANLGSPLYVYTGPANYFPSGGYYADGTRLTVYCVTLYGQRRSVYAGGPSDTGWSRLTNGWFVPRIALHLAPGQAPVKVPQC